MKINTSEKSTKTTDNTGYKYVLKTESNITYHKDWEDIFLNSIGYNSMKDRINSMFFLHVK